jgi:hypothetical protein
LKDSPEIIENNKKLYVKKNYFLKIIKYSKLTLNTMKISILKRARQTHIYIYISYGATRSTEPSVLHDSR